MCRRSRASSWKVEFRIDNNSAAFRSKTDTYISYLIGNRSKTPRLTGYRSRGWRMPSLPARIRWSIATAASSPSAFH